MRRWLLLVVLLCAVPLFAQEVPFSISPASGPVGGGNEVTVKGNFGTWPYGLIFGDIYVPAERRDEHTLVAIAPPHLPGPVPVNVFEGDFGIQTGLTYTFTGALEESFERLLLPVFTPPIHGAFGSEFRTQLNVRLAKGDRAELHGVHFECIVLCVQRPDSPVVLTTDNPDLDAEHIERTGTPGAFVYVPKTQANRLSMNLRAFDVSRASDSFGTQLPIVRSDAFTKGYEDKIVIVGIPSDPKFRSHLRIYSAGTTPARVLVEMSNGYAFFPLRQLEIPAGASALQPGYVDFTDFPVNDGTVRVEIRYAHDQNTTLPAPELWAFVSVTNNETQHITTITPR
jgi:hypothetical protein